MIARALLVAVLMSVLLAPGRASAQETVQLSYIGLAGDPYYDPQALYTGLSLRDRHRPIEGVRLAFRDTRVLGRALGLSFDLQELLIEDRDAVTAAIAKAQADGALAIFLDLPQDVLAGVAPLAQSGGVLVNVRDGADRWRGAGCIPGLLHSAPSDSMLSDALAQYLRARGWDRILLLHGDAERDAAQADAVRRSAAKFGLTIAAERGFTLTNDPRKRDQSNIALMTGGVRHDVIWLVDSIGEFGRYVPFSGQSPRPVVGAEGLRPVAWHWTFERFGAPQLNQRFRRLTGRDMSGEDWSGWAAMRAVVDAVTQAKSVDLSQIRAALLSPDLRVDLYKGVRGNFRPWNGQLRQPILLATHNAVLAVAPLDGFDHQFERLDTLGLDAAEATCVR